MNLLYKGKLLLGLAPGDNEQCYLVVQALKGLCTMIVVLRLGTEKAFGFVPLTDSPLCAADFNLA
jgi:hypothetical protein